MGRIRIKICGVTNPDDAALCVEAGVSMIGLIFAKSPRKIDARRADEIIRAIPADHSSRLSSDVGGPFAATPLKAHPVGVFQDQPLEEVLDIIQTAKLVMVQLHGNEPPEYARALKEKRYFVIRAFTPDSIPENYPADLFLLDVPKGEERADDAYRAAANRFGQRLFLSGQLDASNVGKWIRDLHPIGVDVCRGTEKEPGKKDAGRIRAFVDAVRSAE